MTEDVASLFSVKVATPPCAASKFKLCVENNPPYDCNHAEDSLFYEHRSIGRSFFVLNSDAVKCLLHIGDDVVGVFKTD